MKGRTFALGLGGNTGEVEDAFRGCLRALESNPLAEGIRISPVYSTSPWGGMGSSTYLNAVLCGLWSGSDHGLLELCRGMEVSAGSKTDKEGSDRPLDVDILFIEGGVSKPELVIPHPRMWQRRFVLVPLADVWKSPLPGLGLTPDELLERVEDGGSVIFHGMLGTI